MRTDEFAGTLAGAHETECNLKESHSDAGLTLAAVGDIVMDRAVQISARALMNHAIQDPHLRIASGFERLFVEIKDNLAEADIVFGNLETPLASGLSRRRNVCGDRKSLHRQTNMDPGEPYDGRVYTGAGFSFNAHPALALALKNTGFNIVSTANNHSLDRGSAGVDLTIDALRTAGIDPIGTRRSTESGCAPHTIKDIKGIRVAFFAWTLPLNRFAGLPCSDKGLHQVSTLTSAPPDLRHAANSPAQHTGPRQGISSQAAIERITGQIARAKEDPAIDLVVVSVHWGIQCVSIPSPLQRRLAHAMTDAGADIVLGHHPHVLQPIERYATVDGRQAVVAYSLGNFISGYWRPWGNLRFNEQTSVILYVDIIKRAGNTTISEIRYLPAICASRTWNEARIIQVSRFSEYPESSRSTPLIEKSLHGKNGWLAWMSLTYLIKNPFCALLSASDVMWEGIIALQLAVAGLLRRTQKHHPENKT